MKSILLEDNDDRISAFQRTVAALGFDLKIWRDAPSMIAESEAFFTRVALISLDHDLNPMPEATVDPGTGVDVARFLGDFLPVCPVLIHSSNTDRVYSMHNELRFAGWTVDRVGPLGTDWIETSWLHRARELLAQHPALQQVKAKFSWSVFMKGTRQTSRHERKLSIIQNDKDFLTAIERYAQDAILNWQDVVCREFVPLRRLADDDDDTDGTKMPRSFEFRTFWWKGTVRGRWSVLVGRRWLRLDRR